MHYFNKESPEKNLRPWVQIPLKPRIFFGAFFATAYVASQLRRSRSLLFFIRSSYYDLYHMHVIFKIMCLCQSQYSIFLHQGVDYLSISDNYWLGTTKPCITYGLRWVCLTYISSVLLPQFHPHYNYCNGA